MKFIMSARQLLAVSIMVAAACSVGVEEPVIELPPTPTQGTSTLVLNKLDTAAGAPAIANPVVQFYAVKGEDREAFMYYAKRPTGNDSTVFVRFRVRKRSLLARPDGTPIADGDSVLITMTLTDPAHLEVTMAPAGLTFSPSDPADIKLSFLETDDDLNKDGSVNAADAALQNLLSVWKRETPTAPWTKLPSTVSAGSHEIEADVTGFTIYIVAW